MNQDNTASAAASETTWNASAYAANTAHHRRYDAAFLSSTPLERAMTVVDVGCGSGDFTRVLAESVRPGTVIGVDPQRDLVELAQRVAHDNQEFVVGKAQDLGRLIDHQSVDAVVSRAALHWVPPSDHAGLLDGMFQILRPGGCLRIEMGGSGNIGRVVETLGRIAERYGAPRKPWYFPTDVEYRALIERAGFELGDRGFVTLEPQQRPFDESSLQGWLESQVLNAFEVGLDDASTAAFRAEVERSRSELSSDGEWGQHFVRLQALAFKPA